MSPKYSRLEIERRWLVPAPIADLVRGAQWSEIEDRYISGTRLRLRKLVAEDQSVQWKLCKKYGRSSEFSEPIANLYLSAFEYAALEQLPAVVARKRRYRVTEGSIDVYASPVEIVVFEAEFESEMEALSFQPPWFVSKEVTGEHAFSGAALAGAAT